MFVWVQAAEGVESAPEVVGCEEVAQVGAQLGVAVVVVALDGGVLDRAVHAFDLSIGPRMVRLGQPVLDLVRRADVTVRSDRSAAL